jgi:hypothetical protein
MCNICRLMNNASVLTIGKVVGFLLSHLLFGMVWRYRFLSTIMKATFHGGKARQNLKLFHGMRVPESVQLHFSACTFSHFVSSMEVASLAEQNVFFSKICVCADSLSYSETLELSGPHWRTFCNKFVNSEIPSVFFFNF